MNEEIKERILNWILNEEYVVCPGDYKKIKYFDVMPEEYLQFAKLDIDSKDKKSKINAISNVKRAIDCQVDVLLKICGYYKKSKKENWNFPRKNDFLKELGIISPNILKKVNVIRNKIEHEFKEPDQEEIGDAIDLAELFLSATDKFRRNIDCFFFDLSVNDIYKKGEIPHWEIDLEYNTEHRRFCLECGDKVLFSINEDNPIFTKLLKKYLYFLKSY